MPPPTLSRPSATTYTWDYRNRLWWSREGVNDGRLYTYNPANQRVGEGTPASATYYPTREYEESPSSSQKKYVFLGDTLVATIENGAPYYVQTDHLSGSNVVTSASGTIAELLDYEPYGKTRIDEQTSSFRAHRTFTGHLRDESTGLQYMEARYYHPAFSRFLSEDAVFLALGDEEAVKKLTGRSQEELLSDPQLLNSYAYARNNPMKYVDRTGNNLFLVVPVALGAIGGFAIQYVSDVRMNYNNGVRGVHMLDPHTSPDGYLAAAVQGGVVAGAAEAGLLTGGLAAVGTTLASDWFLNGEVNYENAITTGLLTVMTGGVVKEIPKVSGPKPFRLNSNRFISGSHAKDALKKELVGSVLQTKLQQPVSQAISSAHQSLSVLLGSLQSLLHSLSGQLPH